MKPLDERTDDVLRTALARYPRPSPAAELSSLVLQRLAERERLRDRRRWAGTRLLLGAYWLAAAFASAWILGRLPWPEWGAAVAWGFAMAAVPAGYAIALWPDRTRAWLVLGSRPLLPPVER